jgi:magnesium chelatase family protein
MYASTTSVALVGGDVRAVQVEAHVGGVTQSFKLSGLPDTALREAKDRVRAAITSSGLEFPHRAVTVNLAPADLPKRGADYDLPIAIGILAAARAVPDSRRMVMTGELALDGKIRPGGSGLGAAVLSSRLKVPCVVASQESEQAALVPGSEVYAASTLAEAVGLIRTDVLATQVHPGPQIEAPTRVLDLKDVRGQDHAKRALEVAAAGGHHVFLHGPPGGGKTMLARRLPGLLPELSDEAAIAVALVRSGAGIGDRVSKDPPFRSPHHTATRAALVGGGTGVPTPGEISLAHNGVLFLDELAEYPRSHLDALRQPLEEGELSISRQGASMTFPADFQLVGASNPCPCGYFGDYRKPCVCGEAAVLRYRRKVSGPLFDRFDIAIHIPRLDATDYDLPPGETSEAVARRVADARRIQWARGQLNKDLTRSDVERLAPSPGARRMIHSALGRGELTARGADRVHRVAQTIADLDGSAVEERHVAEGLALRGRW